MRSLRCQVSRNISEGCGFILSALQHVYGALCAPDVAGWNKMAQTLLRILGGEYSEKEK